MADPRPAGQAPLFTLREAFGWLSSAVLRGRGDEAVAGVGTDTRSVQPGELFVALRGERYDAHDFVAQAVAAGAAALVVERAPAGVRLPMLIVPDARRALGELARGWRGRLSLPLIAVTGSNGKTTVKEMIASVLRAHVGAAAFATRGNLNNDVGVPLTLLALRPTHRAAVVELGMNHPGEIDWLAEQSQPGVALVNNAQREHQEFMDGPEATARENGAVLGRLAADGVAVFPSDDACAPIWRTLAGARRRIEFGFADGPGQPTVRASGDARPEGFVATIGAVEVPLALAIAGRHNVRNALAAAACCLAIDVPVDTIARGLADFRPVAGRLRRLAGRDGATLIDDSYNANPDSVRAAIDLLADEASPRLLVLGDMGEVGDQGPAFHREVGAYARERGIERLVVAGAACADTARAYGDGAIHHDTVEALIAGGLPAAAGAASVLVKGSRFMRMERVVALLAQPTAASEAAALEGAH